MVVCLKRKQDFIYQELRKTSNLMKMGEYLYLSFAVLLAVSHTTYSSVRDSVTMSTTLGDVRGVKKSAGEGQPEVEIYYSIPFAKPPTGDLRFRAPVAAEPWGETALDGTSRPHACWQAIDEAFNRFSGVEMWNPNTERSEDCLYLNVWRPATSDQADSSSPKTIMVWIFGGGFWSGSAVLDMYDGTQLAARKDVIVVTIAYRLGPLGFLYLGNSDVPGNAGLLDQAMALQWIKDNAVNFGGSPDDITLFGESAGAASVGFHLMSPLTRDLFKNAIMQSTAPTAFWAVMDLDKSLSRSQRLASNVSCPTQGTADELLACLRSVDAQLLTDQQWILADKWFDVPIGPIVDGVFLPDHPSQMLLDGDVKLTDIIIGVDKNEGIYWDIYGFMDEFPLEKEGALTKRQFHKTIKNIAEGNRAFARQLIEVYTLTEKDKSRAAIVDAVSGDYLFKCDVVEFARQYANVGGMVYVYSFDENFSSNPWPDWMGVPHGYEIEVVFGQPLAPGSQNTDTERTTTQTVMDLWTTFAKTGSPNDGSHANWPVYTNGHQKYVVIDAQGVRVRKRLRSEACQLWALHRRH